MPTTERKPKSLNRLMNCSTNGMKLLPEKPGILLGEDFSLNGIELRSFKNGEEFTNSVLIFIGDELKNLDVKSEEESRRVYAQFADSTWFVTIQPIWMNYLIENKMLTDESKNKMESKIAEWKNALYPSCWWIYLIIALVIIGAGAFFFMKKRKPKVPDNISTKE